MDDSAQAEAYAEADFAASDAEFVNRLTELFPAGLGSHIVDLGCGPGNISLRLAARFSDSRVTGIDGARAMLEIAERRRQEASLGDDRLLFEHAFLPSAELAGRSFSAVVSNSLLHHLHDPEVLWQAVADLAAPGAPVYIKDLRRPESIQQAQAIVDAYAADAPDILRQDFFNSLRAAFTKDEVREQLDRSGVKGLEVADVADRYIEIWGRLS